MGRGEKLGLSPLPSGRGSGVAARSGHAYLPLGTMGFVVASPMIGGGGGGGGGGLSGGESGGDLESGRRAAGRGGQAAGRVVAAGDQRTTRIAPAGPPAPAANAG